MSSVRVQEIILPQTISKDYIASEPFQSLVGVKRLNSIVGPNNSGKSRLLRAMFIAAGNSMISTSNEHAVEVRAAVRTSLELVKQIEERDDWCQNLTAGVALAMGDFVCHWLCQCERRS
jgi:ABC-type branched-subunit amino acid transport system ATPase component